ncbi:hypothetical protein BG004_005647, partial [Podila humilis]
QFETIPGFTLTDGTRATITELLDLDEVAYIEQDAVVSIAAVQKSPPSWGLPRVGQRKRLTSPKTSYLSHNAAGAGVTAYVIDTGINIAHSDFGGRAKMGKNFIPGEPNTDSHGHGTHVAGTIGGKAYGVAKKVQLVGVKVLGRDGRGSTSGIVAAMDWVITVNKGKRAVVNMSLGGAASRAVNDATTRLYRANIPVIVAAGNDADTNACSNSPAGAPNVITVGATDYYDKVAAFSSYGKCVKIFAPGVSINSAMIGSKTASGIMSGTSMASPHVAGVTALIMSANPKLKTSKQIYDRLISAGTKNAVKGNLRGSPNLLVFNGGGK